MKRAALSIVVACLAATPTSYAQLAQEPVEASAPAAASAREDVALPPADLEIEGLDVQPGGLTSDDVARRAVAVNSDVKRKQAEVAQANAKIDQTIYQFWPQLIVRGSYTRLSPAAAALGGGGAFVGAQRPGELRVGPCPMGAAQCLLDLSGQPVQASVLDIKNLQDSYTIGASLVVPLSDYALRLSSASDSADASQESARYNEEAARLRVATDARVMYLNWLRAHGQVAIAKKALARNRARLEDAHVAESVGTATHADVLRLEALVANSEQTLQQAESLRNLIEATLVITMSDTGAGEYHVGEGIPAVNLPLLDRDGLRKLARESLQRRLELKALDATQAALASGESAVRAGSWPRLDAVADFTYANPNPRYFPAQREWNATWSAGVVATWNLAEMFLNGARGDELSAEVESLRAQRIGLVASIAYEVVNAQLDLGRAYSSLGTSEVALRAATEAYRVTTDLFRVGRATTTDLIAAETELLGAKLSSTNARIDLAIAALRLRHATGDDVAER